MDELEKMVAETRERVRAVAIPAEAAEARDRILRRWNLARDLFEVFLYTTMAGEPEMAREIEAKLRRFLAATDRHLSSGLAVAVRGQTERWMREASKR